VLSGGVRVLPEHLSELLRSEVLKRDVLEGDRAEAAAKLVRKLHRKRIKVATTPDQSVPAPLAAGMGDDA